MKNLTTTLLFSALGLFATAQTFDEKTYTDINKRFEKDPIGYLKANAAPDYTLTSNGQVSDLKALLARFDILNLVSWVASNVKIRQYGTTAVVTGTVKHNYTIKTDGSPIYYADLFTYTFSYQSGKWLLLGSQHSDIPLDQKQEEAAIKAALEAETKAYHDGNSVGQQKYWNFTPQTRAIATTIEGQTLYGNSGDEVRQFFSDLKPTNNTFSNNNYNIKIGSSGKMAWATYDQKTLDKESKTLYLAHEIRFLENVNGVWKVVVLSAHHYKP